LPGLDGLEICRQIRAAGVTTPVLICSAHAATEDYVSSLEAGADDYLAKPFAPEEWLARVHALGRRGRHIGPAVAPGMSGVAEADDAPGVTMSDGTLEEAPTRRAQRLAGYLRHAWAASMHRLSPGR